MTTSHWALLLIGLAAGGWLDRWCRRIADHLERRAKLFQETLDLLGQVERLQCALHFWLPAVPPNDPDLTERICSDAHLLVGLEGEREPGAEKLGWISKRPPPWSPPSIEG